MYQEVKKKKGKIRNTFIIDVVGKKRKEKKRILYFKGVGGRIDRNIGHGSSELQYEKKENK